MAVLFSTLVKPQQIYTVLQRGFPLQSYKGMDMSYLPFSHTIPLIHVYGKRTMQIWAIVFKYGYEI